MKTMRSLHGMLGAYEMNVMAVLARLLFWAIVVVAPGGLFLVPLLLVKRAKRDSLPPPSVR